MKKATTHTFFKDRTTTLAPSPAIQPLEHNKSFHFYGNVSAATGSAACDIEGSNDGETFAVIDAMTLTLGTAVTHDTYQNDFGWAYIRANLKTLTGTGAEVTLVMAAH